MTKICEHEFEAKDPENPDYSMTEYDLYAKLDMTIRKNHKSGRYEIVRISDKELINEGTLGEMVAVANNLEGADNTEIGCDNIICSGRKNTREDHYDC